MKMIGVWDVAPCSLHYQTLTMEAASTSETQVKFYQNTGRDRSGDKASSEDPWYD
jgi:hypothetical protein